jgi:hypothetical protein
LYSTVGLEMAAMGRTVVRGGGGWCPDKSFLRHGDVPGRYDAVLDGVRARPGVTTAEIVATWRFAYLFFLRQSHAFPLVEVPHWSEGRMAYQTQDALLPGRDAGLDAICEGIMRGTSLAPVPEPRGGEVAAHEAALIAAAIADFAPSSAG